MSSTFGAWVGGIGAGISGAKLGAIISSAFGLLGTLGWVAIGGMLGGHGAKNGSKHPEAAVALGVVSTILPGAGVLDEAIRGFDAILAETLSSASAHLYTNT